MSVKSLQDRVADAFDDRTVTTFGQPYLEIVLDRWVEATRTLRRVATLILVLMLAFVVLAETDEAELNLGVLKVADVTAVLLVIPVLATFLYYEMTVLLEATAQYRRIVHRLVRQMYPKLAANELDLLLAPATAALWGRETWRDVRATPRRRAGKLLRVMDIAVVAAVVGGCLAFVLYAFRYLYVVSDANWWVVTASLAVTIFNVARAYVFNEDVPIPPDDQQRA